MPSRSLAEYLISIHALREEGDQIFDFVEFNKIDFYPRPPRGGRLSCYLLPRRQCPISIHALREEGDLSGGAYTTHRLNFYPRPPRGGRPI